MKAVYMAWTAPVTSALLTCDANWEAFHDGTTALVVALAPYEVATFFFSLASGIGETDGLEVQILGGHRLINNDIISLGDHRLKFVDPSATSRTTMRGAGWDDTTLAESIKDFRKGVSRQRKSQSSRLAPMYREAAFELQKTLAITDNGFLYRDICHGAGSEPADHPPRE